MQAKEALQKTMQKIAAQAVGQVPNVRYVMGRQLLFLNQQQSIMLLPHLVSADGEPDHLQLLDTSSPDYGQFYTLVGLDGVDSGTLVS